MTLLTATDRPLPHNLDAERAVLGCMLLNPRDVIDHARAKLGFPGAWHNPAHQVAFDHALQIFDACPKVRTVDLLMLTDSLEKAGMLELVGGVSYLSTLMSAAPTAANYRQYVSQVQEAALKRAAIRVAANAIEAGYDSETDAGELLATTAIELSKLSSLDKPDTLSTARDIMPEVVQRLDALQRGEEGAVGLSTGFRDLVNLMPLRRGEMIVVAARPSVGKTAFATNIATYQAVDCDPPNPVGIFSLEMQKALLVGRMVNALASVSDQDIRNGAVSASRWQEIQAAAQRIAAAPLYIDDASGLTVEDIRARARRMVREYGVRLIIVDYLQLLRETRAKGDGNRNREEKVRQMSGGCKEMAKELNVPVMVLAQLNRQSEAGNRKPRKSDLRESGAIEQDADIVALLHHDGGGVVEVIVDKHRNGPCGDRKLLFIPQFTRFEDHSGVVDSDVPADMDRGRMPYAESDF